MLVSYWPLAHTATRFYRFESVRAAASPDMLPVFNGADSVFRGILVPVFGLKAQLLRRDARVLAEESTKGLTEEQKAAVVASFNEGVAKKTN